MRAFLESYSATMMEAAIMEGVHPCLISPEKRIHMPLYFTMHSDFLVHINKQTNKRQYHYLPR